MVKIMIPALVGTARVVMNSNTAYIDAKKKLTKKKIEICGVGRITVEVR